MDITILGARVKNEKETIKNKILSLNLNENNPTSSIKKQDDTIIISYSTKRAKKDEYNRKKGIKRLEDKISSGKLTKDAINNRGYNKYLSLQNDVHVKINYDKFQKDKLWDGLKGYITNTDLSANDVMQNYSNLWHIEKAFRISKTDLKIRPMYHHKKRRIEAHISISFVAYAIYKELERVLEKYDTKISTIKAFEELKTIYGLEYINPITKEKRFEVLRLNETQEMIKGVVENEGGCLE